MHSVMQRKHERGRLVVEGRRTDTGGRCSLVVVSEVGGSWVAYAHGDTGLGVWLARADAVAVTQWILDGVR